MIRLENIRLDGDCISCEAFVEDCKTPIQLSVNKDDTSEFSTNLPSGHEWCLAYVKVAERYLKKLFRVKALPVRKIIHYGEML